MFTTVAFVFAIFGLAEVLGFNGAIAALAFGITIGNAESIRFPTLKKPLADKPVGLTAAERAFFSEGSFLLKTFFFVYLGICLEFANPWLIGLGLFLTVMAFILRIPAVKVSVSKLTPVKDSAIMAIMVPKGLAAAVLASIPLQQGIAGGELIRSVTYSVVLFSIVATSVLILLLNKTKLAGYYERILSLDTPKLPFRIGPANPEEPPKCLGKPKDKK